MRPRIGITLGDGAGIGPEVTLKALKQSRLSRRCRPVIIGDRVVLDYWRKRLRISLPSQIEFIPVNVLPASYRITPGKSNPYIGKAALEYVRVGAELAKMNKIDALVTAPLSKETVQKRAKNFTGHTGYLAGLSGAKKVSMMFAGGPLKLVLATIHIPLKKVPRALTKEKVFQAIEHAVLAGKLFGKKKPHVAVAGLNPHAGEAGLMGTEEKTVIEPAIRKALKKKWHVSGPYPPDTLFHEVLKNKTIDVVAAMYHDQGLIALKTVAFDESVNITLGLPFARTSPDHGTAFDLAGKNKANPMSMTRAIEIAAQLARK